MTLTYPEIDPIALEIGPLVIRWYALSYLAGILLGWVYVRRLAATLPVITKEQIEASISWVVIGVILGGRIGYVLFYNLPFYLAHPSEILQMWHGGMSFHGGMLGVILATYLFCRKHQLRFWAVIDTFACAAPIGLFLGRIANFINGELYGNVTDSALGMVFPDGGPLPRHPSQLYEAFLEGLCLFVLLFLVQKYTNARKKPRLISGLFLIGYGISRFVVEFFRMPDEQLGYLFFDQITMGHLLSAPMVLLGLFLVYLAAKAPALNMTAPAKSTN